MTEPYEPRHTTDAITEEMERIEINEALDRVSLKCKNCQTPPAPYSVTHVIIGGHDHLKWSCQNVNCARRLNLRKA